MLTVHSAESRAPLRRHRPSASIPRDRHRAVTESSRPRAGSETASAIVRALPKAWAWSSRTCLFCSPVAGGLARLWAILESEVDGEFDLVAPADSCVHPVWVLDASEAGLDVFSPPTAPRSSARRPRSATSP